MLAWGNELTECDKCIFSFLGLVVFDTISAWSIERKSRSPEAPSIGDDGGDVIADQTIPSRPKTVTKFRTRTSLFMVIFELCLCGVMLGAVTTWYYYATALVQDETFKTE